MQTKKNRMAKIVAPLAGGALIAFVFSNIDQCGSPPTGPTGAGRGNATALLAIGTILDTFSETHRFLGDFMDLAHTKDLGLDHRIVALGDARIELLVSWMKFSDTVELAFENQAVPVELYDREIRFYEAVRDLTREYDDPTVVATTEAIIKAVKQKRHAVSLR